MANTVAQVTVAAGVSVGDGLTRYAPISGSLVGTTTESKAQTTYRSIGTFSRAGAYVSFNDAGNASTAAVRVNGSTSALSVSITANTTGLFEDTSNTVTIAAADEVNWLTSVPSEAGNHSVTFRNLFCSFNAASNTYQKPIAFSTSITYGSVNVNYVNTNSDEDLNVTEANVQFTYRTDGTLKNGFASLSANTRDSTTTIKSRVDGADGNIAVSITASTTGIFEDTSGTDTITSGQKVNMSIQGTVGTGSGTFDQIGMEFETTNSKSHAYSTKNTGTAYTAATSFYLPLTGINFSTSNTTEANNQFKSGFTFTASKLQIYISVNAATSDGTFTFRNGGSNTALTVSVTALTTGLFEDASNSTNVALGDLVNYIFTVGSVGASTVNQMGCMIEATTPPAGTTILRLTLPLLGAG